MKKILAACIFTSVLTLAPALASAEEREMHEGMYHRHHHEMMGDRDMHYRHHDYHHQRHHDMVHRERHMRLL
ncbi:hypothetical protein [Methylocella silvestris]|uniref:hypothetical protein n=1 Tax=Methylocella silvestris TaxID=199596 RepID=UPI0011D081AB|nr:hypothetical protein [Methylocella silvestris]